MGDLHKVVATGDRLRSLRAIRNHLATQLDKAPPQNSAQIAAQLGDLTARIRLAEHRGGRWTWNEELFRPAIRSSAVNLDSP